MKKFIYSALAVLSLLVLVGCNKDNKQPKNQEIADAYLSLTFNLPSGDSGMRDVSGKNDKETYEGTKEEQKISSVLVVLYDTHSGEVAYNKSYAITSDGTAAPSGEVVTGGTAAKFTTKAMAVEKKDYRLLAIVNPTTEAKALFAEGKTIDEGRAALSASVEALKGNGILMSNEQDLILVTADKLKESTSAAEQAPVKVSVDRILAKVFVGSKNGTQPQLPAGVTFTHITWQLSATNKKTYVYRQLDQAATSTVDVFHAETFADADRYYRYAKDPNFNTFDKTEFDYLTGDAAIKNTFGYADESGEYCLENTMDAAHQLHQGTTTFILKGTWKPADHNNITFKEGETFYDWTGWTFTKKEAKEYKKALEDHSKTEIDGTPAGFKKAFEAAKLEIDENGDVTKSAVKGDKVLGEVKAYKDGVCYYPTNKIRHFNNTLSSKKMGYGRYGVVRNNIYKINITKIKGVGVPVLPENPGDDTTPNDPDDLYVAFEVTVNPWIVRTQDIEL